MKYAILILMISVNAFGLTAAEAKKETMVNHDKNVQAEFKLCMKKSEAQIKKSIKRGDFDAYVDGCGSTVNNLLAEYYKKLGYYAENDSSGTLCLSWGW